MKVSMKKKEKEVTGTFPLKGGGNIHLRLRTDADIKEMRKATEIVTVEYPYLPDPDDPTGKAMKYIRFESVKIDHDLEFQMIVDKNVVGWDGIEDDDGKPVEVTMENKMFLATNNEDFADAFGKGLKALKESAISEAKAKEKNSMSG